MNKNIIGGEYIIDRDIDAKIENGRSMLFANGRSALRGIIEHSVPEKQGGVLIPDYICESIPETIKSLGLKCVFYHINEDFLPLTTSIYEKIDCVQAIILVNYFGMISSETINNIISEIKKHRNNIVTIVDDVQNYYGLESENTCDYAFTSYRKWFPVPDGADVIMNNGYSRQILYPSSRYAVPNQFAKYKFAGNILKNYRDVVGDDICLELIERGERLISENELEIASPWTSGLMENININQIKIQRQKNAQFLHKGLVDMQIPHLFLENASPLFVPILLRGNRDRIRRAFFKNNVYCPIHWKDDWKDDYDSVERNPLSDWELSLICDQRYDENAMQLQLEILKRESVYY